MVIDATSRVEGGGAPDDPDRPKLRLSVGLRRLLSRDMVYPRTLFTGLESHVSHTIREKSKLLNRVRRIRGQIEGVERALEQEIGCADVMQLIAAARGAINGLMVEVMEDHIRLHVIDPGAERSSERARATEELIDVVRSYLK
jgi:DNA-binding FrmR family transcriptional regulator